jgi:hypothetical protein
MSNSLGAEFTAELSSAMDLGYTTGLLHDECFDVPKDKETSFVIGKRGERSNVLSCTTQLSVEHS